MINVDGYLHLKSNRFKHSILSSSLQYFNDTHLMKQIFSNLMFYKAVVCLNAIGTKPVRMIPLILKRICTSSREFASPSRTKCKRDILRRSIKRYKTLPIQS
uniref:Uncharacterized protein n=1 Tax=Schistocephalus solidus TaxID=70667 RepID=A0A0X3PBG0_SCHSO